MFTAAIVLRPCQADRSFPSVNFSSTLFLYFSLAVFMARLTSLLTSFFSDSEPVKKILIFLLRTSFSYFVTQGLLFGKMVTVLEGMMLSSQKLMYDETVSTCSTMSFDEDRKIFQAVNSQHPCSV